MIEPFSQGGCYLLGEVTQRESGRVNRISSTKAMLCVREPEDIGGIVDAVYSKATGVCCSPLQPSATAALTSFEAAARRDPANHDLISCLGNAG